MSSESPTPRHAHPAPRRQPGALATVSAFFIVMGWVTFHYPPGTIIAPPVTGWMFVVGGLMGATRILMPRRHRSATFSDVLAATAGAFLVLASVVRAFSIWATRGWGMFGQALGLERPGDPTDVSFFNGGLLWVAIAGLLSLVWAPIVVASDSGRTQR